MIDLTKPVRMKDSKIGVEIICSDLSGTYPLSGVYTDKYGMKCSSTWSREGEFLDNGMYYLSDLENIPEANEQLYYMEDTRRYVGNSMSWWAKGHKGYVCDVRKAHVFTLAEAKKYTQCGTNIVWPKEYIDGRVSHEIDMRCCDHKTGKAINMGSL